MESRRQNFQSISWFWDLKNRDRLELDPPYQRRSVWNQSYKDYFIDTILLGYPAPAIFLFEDIAPSGLTAYSVVDGKQRLTAIFEFVDDTYPVSDASEKTELRGMLFSELSDDVKKKFWSYQFTVEYLPSKEESVINNIFNRINRNVAKLTRQELRHAKYDGDFISAVEDLSEYIKEFLPDNFPRIAPQSRKQRKDDEFISQLLLLIENGVRGYTSDELDKEYSDRDTDWDQKWETENTFKKVIKEIDLILNTQYGELLIKSRLKNQADFYGLFGALFELSERDNIELPDPEVIGRNLINFVQRVDDHGEREKDENTMEYWETTQKASNNQTQRTKRIRVLKDIITDQTESTGGEALVGQAQQVENDNTA